MRPVMPAQRRQAGELEEGRRDVGQDPVAQAQAARPRDRRARTGPG